MFDRPAWVVYVALFFAVYAVVGLVGDRSARNARRNLVIAAGSIGLYALWNSTAALFLIGLCVLLLVYSRMSPRGRRRTAPLVIAAALGYLAFVKYAGFAAQLIGADWKHYFFVIGISFYVFTFIGYVVDTAYRGHEPLSRLSDTAILLSFWPHLAAGPILRLENIRQHIRQKLVVSDGRLRLAATLIIGGVGKKLFLADNFGTYVNANLGLGLRGMTGLEATATLLGFAAQIYFDFSGYSDIAIGSALLMGFRLPANFNYPYRACSLREFWTRWHISLSTWFRDYLYIPLGGSRRGVAWLNVLIVFALSGLWHGAAFHFVVWGLVHGVALCLERVAIAIVGKVIAPTVSPRLVRLGRAAHWAIKKMVVVLAWTYFRADWRDGSLWLGRILDFRAWHSRAGDAFYYTVPFLGVIPSVIVDHLLQYYRVESGFIEERVGTMQMMYAVLLFACALLFSGSGLPFMYIQF